MPKKQTPLSLWATHTHSIQSPRCHAMLNQQKANQKFYHDSKSASDLPPLLPGDQVTGSKRWNPAIVVKRHVSPRSYIVESGGHEYRRNRRQLHRSTEAANTTEHCSDLSADDGTPHLNNDQPPSPPTEPCDGSSSQQQEPATTSSAETLQPDEPYTTRSGRAVRCPQRLDIRTSTCVQCFAVLRVLTSLPLGWITYYCY